MKIYSFIGKKMKFKPWSEAWEQQQLCSRLDINWYVYTAIINDMWTSSFAQKNKAKALWLKPWMSDMIIILKRGNVLFLELKKAKWKRGWNNWSVVSEHQLFWQEKINECSWSQYVIGYGYKQAIEEIELLENN